MTSPTIDSTVDSTADALNDARAKLDAAIDAEQAAGADCDKAEQAARETLRTAREIRSNAYDNTIRRARALEQARADHYAARDQARQEAHAYQAELDRRTKDAAGQADDLAPLRAINAAAQDADAKARSKTRSESSWA